MNITHIAWLGHKNFGDDIMALAIRKFLSMQYRHVNYTIWCEGRPETCENISWIYPLSIRNRFLKICFENRTLRKADLLIIGGGSILHSEYSIWWKRRGVEFIKKNNPWAKAVGIGLSLGPFPNKEAELSCCELLRSLNAASFRDEPSYQFAKRCNLPYDPILSFDLAASYFKFFNIQRKDEDAKEIKYVGVSLREPPQIDLISSKKKYLNLIDRLCQTYDKIGLFAFCTGKSVGDLRFIEWVSNSLRYKNLITIPYSGNVCQFIECVKEYDFFISNRLHGSVVSYLLNIPFISISYHKKCDDFSKLINVPKEFLYYQPEFTASDIMNNIKHYMLPDQEPFISESMRNFDVFPRVN